jgi:hypothetical protein
MNWTVSYKRGSDNEQVTELASSEAAARTNYAKHVEAAPQANHLWVELKRDGVLVQRWPD